MPNQQEAKDYKGDGAGKAGLVSDDQPGLASPRR
jgi:hypothetical protein